VAQDFNNWLTVILGTTDLVLATTRLDERAQAHLASVQSAAERAAELTAQLLAFGRKQVLEPAVFCPNTSLVHLRPLFERLIPESIALQVSVTPELGRARIDAARLEQVLVNLVTNACDAMPEGGTLRIATTNRTISEADALSAPVLDGEVFVPGPYVSLTVSDTGTGMDDATRAQIFEPFFTTKAVGKGTGLGLATVFGVVRQSGGHIFVTSKLGEGSSFELLFPRVHTVAPSSEVRVAQSPGADALEPLKILLVEDNAAVRNSVCAMLEVAGHRVLQANNGQEAWELIERRETAFDLLLTDVVMPNLNGPELARALRAEQPNARVLFMTGYSEGALAHDAGLNGVAVDGSAYLPKPFTKSMLDIKLTEMFAGAERRKGPSHPLCAEV
jgi:two-component system, cell cycle sensor histidine kinase and response regulator CckA